MMTHSSSEGEESSKETLRDTTSPSERQGNEEPPEEAAAPRTSEGDEGTEHPTLRMDSAGTGPQEPVGSKYEQSMKQSVRNDSNRPPKPTIRAPRSGDVPDKKKRREPAPGKHRPAFAGGFVILPWPLEDILDGISKGEGNLMERVDKLAENLKRSREEVLAAYFNALDMLAGIRREKRSKKRRRRE